MPTAKDYSNMIKEILDNDEDKLTDWEIKFTESIKSQLETRKSLSDKQVNTLEKIWDKLFG